MNLLSVFFAPNYRESLPFFIEIAKSFKFKSDVNEFTIASRIIAKYYNDYNNEELAKPDNFGRLQGDFNLKLMLEKAQIFCNNVKLLRMFESPNSFLSPSKAVNWVDSFVDSQNNNTFAECTYKSVLSVHNNDAFLTAGGSQTFESKEETKVYLSLNHEHGIFLTVPMWLTHENYNNNFAGVKLSGGESTFKKSGDYVLKSIQTKSFDFLEVIEKYGLTIDKISLSNGIDFLKDYKF